MAKAADLRTALKIRAEGLNSERDALIAIKLREAGINVKSMLIVRVFLCGQISDKIGCTCKAKQNKKLRM